MLKAVIVNCFDTYEERVDLIHKFIKEQGYEVTIIQSNFRHIKKVHREDFKKNYIFIKTNPYYKNLSVARLSSHYNYAKNTFKLVEKIKPDLLYTFIPPNSLAKFAAKYKRKHNEVKLIFDLIDLWPETMPLGKIKKYPPFTFWKTIRDKGLKFANLVITECDLYQTILGHSLNSNITHTLYLAKNDVKIVRKPQLNNDEIHLAYLGSINNIIDIPKIKAIIKAINRVKPVTLHIIGDGESRQKLIEEIQSIGASVEFLGKIYGSKEKQLIFDKCHFGLNIMKDSVCVGLTMKSIDYLSAGLPIINNIKSDTFDLVEKYNIGFNLNVKNMDEIANQIINLDNQDHLLMRKKAYNLFEKLFTVEAFYEKISNIFLKL